LFFENGLVCLAIGLKHIISKKAKESIMDLGYPSKGAEKVSALFDQLQELNTALKSANCPIEKNEIIGAIKIVDGKIQRIWSSPANPRHLMSNN